jgi:hypothetical protein
MSRLRGPLALFGATIATALIAPGPALAKSKGHYRTVKFDPVYSGSSVIAPGAAGSLTVNSDMDIRERLIGDGKLHVDFTAVPGAGNQWKASGTFTVTAADGDVLRGTSVGTVTIGGQVNSAPFYTRVTGGTGRLATARGRLVCHGTTSTITSVDPATGVIRTKDSGECTGRIRLRRRGRR